MKLEGRVWMFGENIDTDAIIPARYLNTSDEKELAAHCMEDADVDFAKSVKTGDIIVAGKNFGCGSSREHAPILIKAAGISCVIAKSFARIFLRNCINIGLPIIEIKDITGFKEEDILSINFDSGIIENKNSGKKFNFKSYPDFMKKIIESGGWINYAKNLIKGE